MGHGDEPVSVAGAIPPPAASAEGDNKDESRGERRVICVFRTKNRPHLTQEIEENMENEVIFPNRLPLKYIYT